jgi:hypothetical protein
VPNAGGRVTEGLVQIERIDPLPGGQPGRAAAISAAACWVTATSVRGGAGAKAVSVTPVAPCPATTLAGQGAASSTLQA